MMPAFMRFVTERNSLFGRVSVFHDTVHDAHILVHDTTWHGWQFRDPARLDEPTGYYVRGSPIAALIAALPAGASVAVAGLGAGVMAALVSRGQSLTFYEIDREVIELSRDPECFSFLARSTAEITVVEGDAIERVTDAPADSYDLFAMDAFSGGQVSEGMLSDRAMARFVSRLKPHGLAAFHLTSTSLGVDHRPELARLSRGLFCAVKDYRSPRLPRDPTLEIDEDLDLSAPVECRWAAVSRDADVIAALVAREGWSPLG